MTNRPVNFNDPTGHRACGDTEEIDCDGKPNKPTPPVPPKDTPVVGSGGSNNCNGLNPSVVCLPSSMSELDLQHLQFDPTSHLTYGNLTYGNGWIGPPESPASLFDDFFQTLEFSSEAMELVDLVENGILWGRPTYKQIKYALPLGGFEYGIDAVLQLYDDRNLDLTFSQRIGRAGIRALESFVIDGLSIGMGTSAAAALQATVPVPFVPAGAGYVAGSYATSVTLENIVKEKNLGWFTDYLTQLSFG